MPVLWISDPNTAFVLAVIGLLAIYWEMNAPGMIIPGTIGAVMLLAGVYSLASHSPTWYGTLLMVGSIIFLLLEAQLHAHGILGGAGAIALAAGAIYLFNGPQQITPWIAISASLGFGVITVFLTSLAIRAKSNKLLMGRETLVGEIGTARTDLHPNGTVFVRGEYWQARSTQPISTGEKICVTRVEDLLLDVERM